MAEGVTRLGYRWSPEDVTVWVRGDFAWAQILGTVTVDGDGQPGRRPVLDDRRLRPRRRRVVVALLGWCRAAGGAARLGRRTPSGGRAAWYTDVDGSRGADPRADLPLSVPVRCRRRRRATAAAAGDVGRAGGQPAVLSRHAAPAGRRRRPAADARRRRSLAVPRAGGDAHPDPRARRSGRDLRRRSAAVRGVLGLLQRLRPGRPAARGVRRRDRRAGDDQRRLRARDAGRAGRRAGSKPARAVGRARPPSRSRPTAGPPSSDASRCRRAGSAGSSRSRRSRPSWRRRPSSTPRARARSSDRSRSPHRNGRSGSPRPAAACGPSTTTRVDGAVGLAGLRPPPAVRAGRPPRDRAARLCRRPGTAAPAGSSTCRAPG